MKYFIDRLHLSIFSYWSFLMRRESVTRSVVIIIPRILTVRVNAYVCTMGIWCSGTRTRYRRALSQPHWRDSNPVPASSESTTLPMSCHVDPLTPVLTSVGGGPGAVVKYVCLKSRRSRVRTPFWSSSFKQAKCFYPLTRKDSILWEPPWLRAGVLDLRPPGLESYVWRSVSTHSSHHPQEVLLAKFSLYVHKGDLKSHLFHYINLLSFS